MSTALRLEHRVVTLKILFGRWDCLFSSDFDLLHNLSRIDELSLPSHHLSSFPNVWKSIVGRHSRLPRRHPYPSISTFHQIFLLRTVYWQNHSKLTQPLQFLVAVSIRHRPLKLTNMASSSPIGLMFRKCQYFVVVLTALLTTCTSFHSLSGMLLYVIVILG